MRRLKGFTLIELLVVIAIISVLATLLMTNFVGVRQRGRDGVRKSDLRQIQASLEQYRFDNSSYPDTVPCGSELSSGIGTVYMQEIPCDPLTNVSYEYEALPAGCSGTLCTTYTLLACLENPNDLEKDDDDGGIDDKCTTTGFVSFTVATP